ncbi:universal stress protein [Mucilaginibacter celer]|uniref:Universal stress protein n=1 Tax=Mucilaginibacter celer TaxID=2305508 RepID=A0A494VJF5_9SPHI|nr:universal stress protein [Mucilaginibacter celer]AYL95147.1 universal stress protein [Mucilaginibacter celer]
MKTLLIATDFSANARHAAEYGYHLAKQIKANIVLCNAVIVPAEMPQSGMVVWPMDDLETLLLGSTHQLENLKLQLEKPVEGGGFKPEISIVNESGVVTDIVEGFVENNQIDMVLMGTHGAGMSRFLLGNHSKNMIEATTKPLMLISPETRFRPLKKIAFAADFAHPGTSMESLFNLIPFAKTLGAEILLTHIHEGGEVSVEMQKTIAGFMTEVSNKANYSQIYYRSVQNSQVEAGLSWICEHGDVDMLVMVHRPHSFIYRLIKSSHSEKMAGRLDIPLLVFPAAQ